MLATKSRISIIHDSRLELEIVFERSISYNPWSYFVPYLSIGSMSIRVGYGIDADNSSARLGGYRGNCI